MARLVDHCCGIAYRVRGLVWRDGRSPVAVGAMIVLVGIGGGVAFGQDLDEHPAGNAPGVRDIFAGDFDGDGDIDILVGSETDDTIGWFPNNGDGTFGARITIGLGVDAPDTVHADDIDGDGDLDAMAGSRLDNTFRWWENDGSGGFGPEQVLSSSLAEASDIVTADIDGDLDLDIVVAWRSLAGSAGWFRNDGGVFSGLVADIGLGNSNIRAIFACDLDDDGDVDLLYTDVGGPSFAWAENDGGDGLAWVTHEVDPLAGGNDIVAGDLDGDGDLDVAVIRETELDWWASDGGDPPAFTKTAIYTSATVGRSVVMADFDGDGDLDLVSGEGSISNVSWHENDGAASPAFATHVISQDGAPSVQAVVVGNFDGDCDLDVAAGVFTGGEVTWFENDTPASACSPADLASPFCQLDFSDVVAFLTAFGANQAAADLAEPMGQWDFSDVVAFLTAFAAGCA